MGTGIQAHNPTVVSAFDAYLVHQAVAVLVLVALVALAWNVLRGAQLRREASGVGHDDLAVAPEAPARRFLRISFGLLWIVDGALQAQPAMPLGMAPQVIRPAAEASPSWVQHIDNAAATIWSYHPLAAPAAAVWIQISLGLLLLFAPRGNWSRFAGLATVAWGLIVWVIGEAFGQIFAPGLSWMFGAPGAVLLYCVAGALIALPERAWRSERTGRLLLGGIGVFFMGMALLQAWPGRGFWQGGSARGGPGTLTGMVQQMSQTSQPRVLESWLSAFASFEGSHGWAVNLFVVIALAGIGLCLVLPSRRLLLIGVAAGTVLCLADWVLVQDFGFFGGVGTDPNSMVPTVFLLVCGYLAVIRVPEEAVIAETAQTSESGHATQTAQPPVTPGTWRDRLLGSPSYALRSAAALAALGVLIVGAAPLAYATTQGQADPVLSQAVDGTPNPVNTPAPAFALTDQSGNRVSSAQLRGKTVAITFLDPVCTSDCPVIAQEFRLADSMLGSASSSVVLIAVDANPQYLNPQYLRAFDDEEGLGSVHNWLYLTGSLQQLQDVWNSYGVQVQIEPGGAMVAHSEFAYVIDPKGRMRFVLDTDPGPNTEATRSSFAVTLANSLRKVGNG